MHNDSYEAIAENLLKADKILIFPHINMDGDCLGSSAALCLALRELGKEAFVLADTNTPHNLDFLESGVVTRDKNIFNEYDLAILVDCGSKKRIGDRVDIFDKAIKKGVIDHHHTSEEDTAFNFGVIEPGSAATAELIYLIIEKMGVTVSLQIARCIYAAINTDTGSFQHSNTTKRTHTIVTKLYDIEGFNASEITDLLYKRQSISSMRLEGCIIEEMKTFEDGEIAIGCVTQKMLKETDAVMSDSEGVIQKLLGIEGAEVACLLKEDSPDTIRASLRAQSMVDVSKIARHFGGGGHVRAAGCTFNCDIEEAFDTISKAIILELNKAKNERSRCN